MSRPPPRFSRRHADVLRYLLEHPGTTLTDAARALGYNRRWLSVIVNSPEFRTRHTRAIDEAVRRAASQMLRPSAPDR
jgi:DNA-binding MarR family transcriptional regulator